MPISKKDIKSIVIPIWKILVWVSYSGVNIDNWYSKKFNKPMGQMQEGFAGISWIISIAASVPVSLILAGPSSFDLVSYLVLFLFTMLFGSLLVRYAILKIADLVIFLTKFYKNLPEEREGQRPILTQSSLKAIYENLKSGTLYFLNDFFAGYGYFEKVGYENERLYLVLLSYVLGFIVAISSQMLVDIGLGLSLIGFLIFLFFIVLFAFTIRKLGLLAIGIISSFFHLLPEGRKLKEKHELTNDLTEPEDTVKDRDVQTDGLKALDLD